MMHLVTDPAQDLKYAEYVTFPANALLRIHILLERDYPDLDVLAAIRVALREQAPTYYWPIVAAERGGKRTEEEVSHAWETR